MLLYLDHWIDGEIYLGSAAKTKRKEISSQQVWSELQWMLWGSTASGDTARNVCVFQDRDIILFMCWLHGGAWHGRHSCFLGRRGGEQSRGPSAGWFTVRWCFCFWSGREVKTPVITCPNGSSTDEAPAQSTTLSPLGSGSWPLSLSLSVSFINQWNISCQ